MIREDVYELVCEKKGCDWQLDNFKNDEKYKLIMPIPTPSDYLWFYCTVCWNSVAVNQDKRIMEKIHTMRDMIRHHKYRQNLIAV